MEVTSYSSMNLTYLGYCLIKKKLAFSSRATCQEHSFVSPEKFAIFFRKRFIVKIVQKKIWAYFICFQQKFRS